MADGAVWPLNNVAIDENHYQHISDYLVITPFGDVCKQPRATQSGRCGATRRTLCDPKRVFNSIGNSRRVTANSA